MDRLNLLLYIYIKHSRSNNLMDFFFYISSSSNFSHILQSHDLRFEFSLLFSRLQAMTMDFMYTKLLLHFLTTCLEIPHVHVKLLTFEKFTENKITQESFSLPSARIKRQKVLLRPVRFSVNLIMKSNGGKIEKSPKEREFF